MRWLPVVAVLLLFSPIPEAKAQVLEFSSEATEQRFRSLAKELRCLVCQNQSLADSQAGLADDLRREVLTMIEKGDSDAQIIQFLVDRYGEFVLYRPRMTAEHLCALVCSGGPLGDRPGGTGGADPSPFQSRPDTAERNRTGSRAASVRPR